MMDQLIPGLASARCTLQRFLTRHRSAGWDVDDGRRSRAIRAANQAGTAGHCRHARRIGRDGLTTSHGHRQRAPVQPAMLAQPYQHRPASSAAAYGLRLLAGGKWPVYLAGPTGSPEAVARLRFPQNLACGFPALRSSAVDLQHSDSLQIPVGQMQLWSHQRKPLFNLMKCFPRDPT